MRLRSVVLSLLCVAPVMWGQSRGPATAKAAPAQAFVLPGQTSEGCPVGLDVSRGSAYGLVAVKKGVPQGRAELEMLFRRTDAPEVTWARVVVHGRDARGEVMPVAEGSGGAALVEHFEVKPTLEEAGLARSDVRTEKIANVEWVEVTKLGYADGTVWQASAGSRCRVTPNGFKLVAAAR